MARTKSITPERVQENFAARFETTPEECDLWTGPLRNGRPVFYDGVLGRAVYALRWRYEQEHGEPVPDGARFYSRKSVCPNGAKCVNLEHWEMRYSGGTAHHHHHPDEPVAEPAQQEVSTLEELGFPGRTMEDLTPAERAVARERLEQMIGASQS